MSADSTESHSYELAQRHAEALRRIQLKGIGAAVVFLALFAGFAATIRPRDAMGAAIFDAVGVVVLFLIARTYSLRTAKYRLETARTEKPEQVVALLLPFASPWRVRFDPTGEARRLLFTAAKETSDLEVQNLVKGQAHAKKR